MAHGKTLELRELPGPRVRKAVERGSLRYLPVSNGYTVYRETERGPWKKVGHSTELPS